MQPDVPRVIERSTGGRVACFFLLAALSVFQCFGQPVIVRPDCVIVFHFTAALQTFPTSPNDGLNNLSTGCTTWNVSFSSQGFTALNLVLQSAPNTTASGAPGSYVTYLNQTVVKGSNPLIGAIAGASDFAWVVGYNPWVRVELASVTGSGTVDGVALGWAIPSAGASPVSTQNVTIVGPLGQAHSAASIPVVTADDQSYATATVTGIDDVTADGSTHALGSGTARLVEVIALAGNSKVVRCGGSGTGANQGVPIAAGGSQFFPPGQYLWDLAGIFCNGQAGDKYAVIYGH